MRFGIRPMLLAVLALAAGLGAIVSNSTWAASATLLMGCVLWGLAVVGLLVGEGRARVFCAGFTIFVGMYAFAFWDEFKTPARAPFVPALSPVATAFDWLARFQNAPPGVGDAVSAKWPTDGLYYPGVVIDHDPDSDVYLVKWGGGSAPSWLASTQLHITLNAMLRTGHVVMAILLGSLGGLLSCVCFVRATATNKAAQDSASERTESSR